MKILFDQGTPAPLRHALTGHTTRTAYEMSWTQLGNGALLRAAAAEFDALVTTDKNLRHQQNLAMTGLAILILPTTSWPKIRPHQALVAALLTNCGPAMLWSSHSRNGVFL
jgi:hypothetical protein